MDCIWLRFVRNRGYFTCELFEFLLANGPRRIHTDDDLSDATSVCRRQVEAGANVSPIRWRPTVIGHGRRGNEVTENGTPVLLRLAALAEMALKVGRRVAARFRGAHGLLGRN